MKQSAAKLAYLECRNREPWKMNLTVPDLSDIAPRFTSTMSPTATCSNGTLRLPCAECNNIHT